MVESASSLLPQRVHGHHVQTLTSVPREPTAVLPASSASTPREATPVWPVTVPRAPLATPEQASARLATPVSMALPSTVSPARAKVMSAFYNITAL